MYLFIDTETTGFPKQCGPLVQDGQARVCQVAMLLTDEAGRSMAEFSSLVKPDGWTVGEEAGKVHGFTNDLCELYGASFPYVIAAFLGLAQKAETIIAHNTGFDRKMMQIECSYKGTDFPATPWHCTMLQTVPICKLPGNYGDFKWPRLEEALQIVCGRTLGDTAHDALYDVRACKDIFFKLKEEQKEAA